MEDVDIGGYVCVDPRIYGKSLCSAVQHFCESKTALNIQIN